MKPNVNTVTKNMTVGTTKSQKVPDRTKSALSHSPQLSNVCKIFLVCYYIVVALVVVGLILIQHAAWLKVQRENKAKEHSKNLFMRNASFLISKLQPTSESFLTRSNNNISNPSLKLDKRVYAIVGIQIYSNPYNLNADQVAQQLMSAKISSLKKRVKRFACWHSCFGQFRKKAKRILYGSSIPLFSPVNTPAEQTQPVAEVDNRLKKRQTEIEVAVAASQRESVNNELGEGEDTATAVDSTQDVNLTLENATASFEFTAKTVTESKEEVSTAEQKTPSSMIASVDEGEGREVESSPKNEREDVISTTLKDASGEELMQREGAFESNEDVELNPAEEVEDSESPEGLDDGEMSESEESEEDGIDKKDLDEETNPRLY